MLQQLLRRPPGWLIVLCACGLLLSGCQPAGPKREMATVSGNVTLNGEPLDGGRVIFAHVEGPGAVADIKQDGTYTVEAAVGQTAVCIDHRAPSEPPEELAGGLLGMLGKSLVPEKYVDAKSSGLSLDVKSGKNEFNIDMKE